MNRQTVVIVLAILAGAVLIAVVLGLVLGLRPVIQDKKSYCSSPKAPATKASTEKEHNRRPAAYGNYQMAAVQADHPDCSKIGTNIMILHNGSAVDAAVATMICMGTANLHCSGLGGGHFTTIYDVPKRGTQKSVSTIIAREVLPMAAGQNYYKTNSALHGGTAVGVPSELHGLYTAWTGYGRLPWKDLIAPSIKLAEEGFRVHSSLAGAIKTRESRIRNSSITNLGQLLLKPDGTVYKEGDILKRPKFAETLKKIADDPQSFYSGALARDIIADLQEQGSIMTEDDLRQYTSRVRPPITGELKTLGLTMYSPEPPSSGVVMQYIMRLLDGFGFTNTSVKDTATAIETYHQVIESYKFGFGRRSALGDPQFLQGIIEEVLNNMTSDSYIDAIRAKVDRTRTRDLKYYDSAFDVVNDAGTVQVSVISPDGAAVALTGSINYLFGSEVYGERTGIVFNNEMDDFSVPGKVNLYNISASKSNYPAPRKMPMSSMSPSIFLTNDGKVTWVSGSAGGPRIISAMTYVALHNLYFKMDLPEATDMARIHHQLLPNFIQYEAGFDKDILEGLKRKGHETVLLTRNSYMGTVKNMCSTCTMNCPFVCLQAVADGRKGSAPYGF